MLIRPLADTVGRNGSAPFAQLVLEVPGHTYASTIINIVWYRLLKPVFHGLKFGNGSLLHCMALLVHASTYIPQLNPKGL